MGLDADLALDMQREVEISPGGYHAEIPCIDHSGYRNRLYYGSNNQSYPTVEYSAVIGRRAFVFDDDNAYDSGGDYSYLEGFDKGTSPPANERISFPTGASPFTVSAWVYFKSGKTGSATNQRQYVWMYGGTGVGAYCGLFRWDDGTIRVDHGSRGYNTTGTITQNEWHQITYTYNGANLNDSAGKLYIDSVLMAVTDISNDANPLSLGSTSFNVGRHYSAVLGMNGSVAQFCIANRAWSQEEIKVVSDRSFNLFRSKRYFSLRRPDVTVEDDFNRSDNLTSIGGSWDFAVGSLDGSVQSLQCSTLPNSGGSGYAIHRFTESTGSDNHQCSFESRFALSCC